jgi:hypothetical protein
MPLQLPNLDDRRYNDLVAEALARIQTYSQEWTNHNPSDPGITLIELFAYLADMLLYRLNRVTDDNTRKFLKLLNGPDWAEPPDGDLRQEIRTTVLGIRERYRAVTREDYERLSTEGFNRWLIETQQSAIPLVGRARCVPQRNLEAGTQADQLKLRPEHVSVVIVPAAEKPNPNPPPLVIAATGLDPNPFSPQPSAAQISALLSYLDERRLLTTKLHVTGPFYVHVSVQLVVARNPDAVEKDLKDAMARTLASFLNPLPSKGGNGWPFGRDVFVSEIYKALEGIPGLDFITDVMLDSRCDAGDDKCVVAKPIWHAEGDLVGLSIEDHHLPVFDNADIVVVPNTAFVAVHLSVSARAQANAAPAALKQSIKAAARRIFHPSLGGPGPETGHPTDIFKSDIEVAIKSIAGVVDASLSLECTPSDILQRDTDRGELIHVAAGNTVDWRVTITLQLS